MDNFESLATIVEHFKIKQSSLHLFGIERFPEYVQVPHIPNLKMYGTMPVLVDSSGNRHCYSKNTSVLKFSNSSSPPHSSGEFFDHTLSLQSNQFSSQGILESEASSLGITDTKDRSDCILTSERSEILTSDF